MTHRQKLVAYLLAVVVFTSVHNPAFLASALVAVLILAQHGQRRLIQKASKGVLFIGLILSSGYLAMGALAGQIDWSYLALLNLRLSLLALLTAWLMRDVCLCQALSKWPDAQRWLMVVRTQADVFTRLGADYKDAFRSRSNHTPTLTQRYQASSALGLAVLDKAVHNAEAVTQGMRSRGVFDD